MSDTIRFDGTTVNAPDALALAQFYAEITEGSRVARRTGQRSAGRDAFIAFQQVERLPAADLARRIDCPMQLHLDFVVDDLEATGARARAAGATTSRVQPNDHCLVYADPAGHPFCLSTWGVRQLFDS